MASIRKHKTSRFWYACITLPDGKPRQFSTGLADPAEALAAAVAAEREVRRHHQQPHQLHSALSRLAELYTPAEDGYPPEWADRWMTSRAGSVSPATRRLYRTTIQDLKDYMKTHALASWSAFTPAHALAMRNALAAKQQPLTVNVKAARLSALWKAAKAAGVAADNPWASVPPLRAPATNRREFRPAELATLLGAVHGQWRALTLLGLYTGQRLNDLATLQWRHLDLAAGTLTFTAAKTGQLVSLPLAAEALDSLAEDTPGADTPDAPVFPAIYALAPQSRSDQFRRILESVGLAMPCRRNRDRDQHDSRQTAPLSFHSLRHTFTTRLKAAGVSDSIARAIVGHASAEVSRSYTHLDMETMRRAIAQIQATNRP